MYKQIHNKLAKFDASVKVRSERSMQCIEGTNWCLMLNSHVLIYIHGFELFHGIWTAHIFIQIVCKNTIMLIVIRLDEVFHLQTHDC